MLTAIICVHTKLYQHFTTSWTILNAGTWKHCKWIRTSLIMHATYLNECHIFYVHLHSPTSKYSNGIITLVGNALSISCLKMRFKIILIQINIVCCKFSLIWNHAVSSIIKYLSWYFFSHSKEISLCEDMFSPSSIKSYVFFPIS